MKNNWPIILIFFISCVCLYAIAEITRQPIPPSYVMVAVEMKTNLNQTNWVKVATIPVNAIHSNAFFRVKWDFQRVKH